MGTEEELVPTSGGVLPNFLAAGGAAEGGRGETNQELPLIALL